MSVAVKELRHKLEMLKSCRTSEDYVRVKAEVEEARRRVLNKGRKEIKQRNMEARKQVDEARVNAGRIRHLAELNRYGRP